MAQIRKQSWPETHFDSRSTAQITERDFAFAPASEEIASLPFTLEWANDKPDEPSSSTVAKDASPSANLTWHDSNVAESSAIAAARAEAYQRLVTPSARVDANSTSARSKGDKMATAGRRRGTDAGSLIRSIRQSLFEQHRQRKWYETAAEQESISFRFVLTPRGGKGPQASSRGGGKKSFAHVPMASEDGSCPEMDNIGYKPTTSSSATSSSVNGLPMGNISLAELASGDMESFQKLLACSMFLMKDIPDARSPIRPLDLNIRQKNAGGSGKRGTMLALKHERATDLQKKDMANGVRRIAWRVRVHRS